MTVRLAADTLLTLVHWHHGEPHPILAYSPTWHDDASLRARDARARDDLADAGLMHDGRLNPVMNDVVGALTRPDHELFGCVDTVVAGELRRFSVLAGSAYQQGFLLIQDHETDMVTLTALDPDDVQDAFLAQLPPARPANRPGITVTHKEFLALRPGGHPRSASRNLRVLQSLVDQPRSGAGSLYATVRRGNGTPVRTRVPVTYIDTSDGRWLITHHTTGGHRWTTLRPATSRLIMRELRAATPPRSFAGLMASTHHHLRRGDEHCPESAMGD